MYKMNILHLFVLKFHVSLFVLFLLGPENAEIINFDRIKGVIISRGSDLFLERHISINVVYFEPICSGKSPLVLYDLVSE